VLKTMRADLREAMQITIALASAHRKTMIAGRTLMQQAVPISFAFKAAGWLSGLTGAAERLRWVAANAVVLQFGGAAGTLAALGEHGLRVRAALAKRLELAEPDISWHTQRSRILDFGSALANLSGACAKIATDILLLMQSEVAEAHEPAGAGKGGSSTMPQKRNPVGAIAIRANHRRIAGLMATIVTSLEQEHERGAGGWAAEWETLRDLFCLSSGSLEKLRDMLKGLEIDAARMRENLDATLGLTLAESLSMALAGKIGRPEAQHRVAALSKLALARKISLKEVARAEPAVAGNLSSDEIERALDPAGYMGSADSMIDAALAAAIRELERD
jgi:3-carboxy-cis,cis-muconate cycloisomerase